MPNYPTRAGRSKSDPQDIRPGKSWFFGIGINRYQHFSNLNNAVKDVKDIIILLQEKYDTDPNNILTLFDAEATRRNIISTFDQLQKRVGPTDKLLIYYSGHGHLLNTGHNKKGFWVPTDAEKNNTSQYIRNSTVREYIEDINSMHTLLISDACFSGSLFVRGSNRSEFALDELEQRKSRWAICSGRQNEEVYDGNPGTNSPFANSILNILSTNQLPKLNVAKLADRVIELTRANYKQLPEGNPLFGVGHEGGQYIFSQKTSEVVDWKNCQTTGRIEDYRVFLAKYPAGQYTEAAKIALKQLEEGVQPQQENKNSVDKLSRPPQSSSLSEREGVEKKYSKRLISILVLAIGFGASGAIALAPKYDGVPGNTPSEVGLVMALAIGGLVAGIVMKWNYKELKWSNLSLITLGWIIGWAIGWVMGLKPGSDVHSELGLLIGWSFGGLVTGIVMNWKFGKPAWGNVALITIGWIIAGMTGWIFSELIAGGNNVGLVMALIIGWAFGGVIGGGVMLWQFRNIPS